LRKSPRTSPPPPPGIGELSTERFRYALPASLIASHPAEPRGSSRLLLHLPARAAAPRLADEVRGGAERRVAGRGGGGGLLPSGGCAVDLSFADLPALLPRGAHLVFNQSRVFAARVHASLLGAGAGRGTPAEEAAARAVEVLFLAPLSHADPSGALSSPAPGQLWRAMVRAPLEVSGARLTVAPPGAAASLDLEVEAVLAPWIEQGERDGVEAAVRLSLPPDSHPATPSPPLSSLPLSSLPLSSLLGLLGETPLPPYLQREATPQDEESYQTVYAQSEQTGSVAAPTAGLHFTEPLLEELRARGVCSSSLTLHVGAGTFKPVTAPTLAGHDMHAEPFSISADALGALALSAAEGRPIVPVGTTSVRVLESAYWLAARAAPDPKPSGDLGRLGQWDAYNLSAAAPPPSRLEALTTLHGLAEAAGGRLYGATSLCIAPGYRFALCDGMVTNFHAPDSTLMLLVSALLGGADNAREVYEHAVRREYRFLSYGDSSLLLRAR